MHRLKLFVALAFSQAALLQLITIDIHTALAADAAKDVKTQLFEQSAEDLETSQKEHETSYREHGTLFEASTKEAGSSASGAEASPHVIFNVPKLEALQYPISATAEQLNRDATYSQNGVSYSYIERQGAKYIFENVTDGSRSTHDTVDAFVVTNDPVAQVEKDMGVVQSIKEEGHRLLHIYLTYLSQCDAAVASLRATVSSARSQENEEVFRSKFEEAEEEFARLQTAHALLKQYQVAIQGGLRQGLVLCQGIKDRATELTDGFVLIKKLHALQQSIEDDVAAVTAEQGDYAAAQGEAEDMIGSLRAFLKLISDVREGEKCFADDMSELLLKRGQIESVVQEIEDLCERVVTTDVSERQLRVKQLKDAHSRLSQEMEKLTAESSVLRNKIQLLMPLKARYDASSHTDLPAFSAILTRFRAQAEDVETLLKTYDGLVQRAARVLQTLKLHTESYEVMDSDLLRQAMEKVREKLEECDAEFKTISGLRLKVAEDSLHLSVRELLAEVKARNYSAIPRQIQSVQRQYEVFRDSAASAEAKLGVHSKVLPELEAELRHAEMFASTANDREELQSAAKEVKARVYRTNVRRKLVQTSSVLHGYGAALEQALMLLLEAAESYLLKAETQEESIRAKVGASVADPGLVSEVRDKCAAITKRINKANTAFRLFLECLDVKGVREEASKIPSSGGLSLYEKLSQRSSDFTKKAQSIARSLANMTDAMDKKQQDLSLAQKLQDLIEAAQPLVESLKQGRAADYGVPEQPGGPSVVEQSLNALQNSLGTPNFVSEAMDLVVNVLKAALTAVATHADSALALEETAAQAERLAVDVEKGGDQTRERGDIPVETLKASRLMQRHASSAAAALAVYKHFSETDETSKIVQTVPFAAKGIDEKSLAAAAVVLETKARTVEERATAIFEAVVRYETYVRKYLQTHLKELLQALEASMDNLDLKAGIARSEELKDHVLNHKKEFKTARDALSACMSLSTLQFRDALSCSSSALRLVISSAATALVRARELQKHAEDILEESGDRNLGAEADLSEEVSRACSHAVDNLDIAREGVAVYAGCATSIFLKRVATQHTGSGKGTTFEDEANALRADIQSTMDHVNGVREKLQERVMAAAQTLETQIAKVLAVVQRASEDIRIAAPAELHYQTVLVDRAAALEKVRASVKTTHDVPKVNTAVEAAVQNLYEELLNLAEARLKEVESEKSHTETRMHDIGAGVRPSLTEQEETELKATCEKLPQLIKLIDATLEACQQLDESGAVPALVNVQRRQQLVAASAALEAQLLPLCETVTKLFETAIEEAKNRLASLITVLGETLNASAVAALSQVGEAGEVEDRIRHHLESCHILQSTSCSPAFTAGVKEAELAVLKLLLDMGANFQEKCQQGLADASAIVQAPFPPLLLSVDSQKLESNVLPKLSRCQKLVEAANVALAAYESLVRDGSRGTTVSMAAMYADCTAQAEQLDAALSEISRRCTEKVEAIKKHALGVVDRVGTVAKDAAASLNAEEAGNASPTSACADGGVRTQSVRNFLEQGLSKLESLESEWGSTACLESVRAAVGNILAAFLHRALMHVDAGKATLPNLQECVAEGAVCSDPSLAASVEQALTQGAEKESKVLAHVTAAKEWLKRYADCTAEEDVQDVARRTETQPANVSLLEQEASLIVHIRSLEDRAKQYPEQIRQRAKTLEHVAGNRLLALSDILNKGISKLNDLIENTGEDALVTEALTLREKLEAEAKATRNLALKGKTPASSIQNREHVASVLRMLVLHATDLVEKCKKSEQDIINCLQHSSACVIGQPSDGGTGLILHVDSILAFTRVGSMALNILVDCQDSSFVADVAKVTHVQAFDPSSPLILVHAAEVRKRLAAFEKLSPTLATQIRAEKWKSSYQSQLAKVISYIFESSKNIQDDDLAVQQSAKERSKQAADLLETLEGIQGAVIPLHVESGVTNFIKMVVADAAKFLSVAKESLEMAATVIESETSVITASFSTSVKAVAEAAIAAGHQRALSASLLLTFVDPATDPSGEVLDVLKHIPCADVVAAAEVFLKQAEELKTRAQQLRSDLQSREESADAMAVQSLGTLTRVVKSCSAKLELEASTCKCHPIMMPVRDRLASMLGLLKTLSQTWNFPTSLSEYLPLLHGYTREFLDAATAAVSAAESMRNSAEEITSTAGPRWGIVGSGSEEIEAKALHCQGRDYAQVGSALLECIMEALAAGEVEQPGSSRTVLLTVDMAARETLLKETAALQERADKVMKQLSTVEMELLKRVHSELLTEVCRDRISHLIQSLERALERVSKRWENMEAENQSGRAAVGDLEGIYQEALVKLTQFREQCSTSVAVEDIHKVILETLSTCLRTTQQNMGEAEIATTEASVCLLQGDALPTAEGEYIDSQAESAIKRAREHLYLAGLGLDTLQSCTSVASIGQLAQTSSDSPGGPTLAESIEKLVSRVVTLTPRLDGLKDDLMQRQGASEEPAAGPPEQEVIPFRIPKFKALELRVKASEVNVPSQVAAGSDTVNEVKRRLDKIASYLEEAGRYRKDCQECVANDERCDLLVAASDDIKSASDYVSAKLLRPLYAAELELKLLQRFLRSEAGTEGVEEHSASGDGLPGREEDRAPRALTLALEQGGMTPSTRALLEALDPNANFVTRFQELLAGILNAQMAARQTNLVMRAVLVLRRLTQLVEGLLSALAHEQSTCRCEDKGHLIAVTEEFRVLSSNLVLLRSMLGTAGGLQEVVPLLEGSMHKLLNEGEMTVTVAEQAAEAAEGFFDEAAPAGLSHDTSISAKVEKALVTGKHHVLLARIFVNSVSEVIELAAHLALTEDAPLYNKDTALYPLTLEARRITEQAANVEVVLRQLRERLDKRREQTPTHANTGISALIMKLENLAALLDSSISKLKSSSAKAVAQSLRDDANALQLSLKVYLQEPNFPVSAPVFAASVTAVGRNILDHVEDSLNDAEALKASAATCTGEVGVGAAGGESQEDACIEISEFVAISHAALDTVENCKDNGVLQLVLSRPAHDLKGRASVLERASALRRRAATLQTSLLHLLEMRYDKHQKSVHGTKMQRDLLSQVVNQVLTMLEQTQWRGGVSGRQPVDAATKHLQNVLATLYTMEDPPQEQAVRSAGVDAFRVALNLVSDLSAAAQSLLGRANKGLSDQGECALLTETGLAAMQQIKDQSRQIKLLMELARAALYLLTLTERDNFFLDVGQNESVVISPVASDPRGALTRTIKAETDYHKGKVEHLHGFAGILEYQAVERERRSAEACAETLQLLLKALYKGVENVSLLQVPDDIDVEKTVAVNSFSKILEALQDLHADWGFPRSREDLHRTVSVSLLPLLELAASFVQRSEEHSTTARNLFDKVSLRSDATSYAIENVLVAVRRADAYLGLAQAALDIIFTCSADASMREALVTSRLKVAGGSGGEELISATEYSDTVFKRLNDVREVIRGIQEKISGAIADSSGVAEAMIATLRGALTNLSGLEFHAFFDVTAPIRAALEERIAILQGAIQVATREELAGTITRELAAAADDVTRCLGETAYRERAASAQNKLHESVKDLLLSVGAVAAEADDISAKCRGVVEAISPAALMAFFEKAERALNIEIRYFSNVGRDLVRSSQLTALQASYTEVYCAITEEYLSIEGLDEILANAAREGEQAPSAAVMENVLKTIAPALVDDVKLKAEEVANVARDFELITKREQEKVKRALAQVLPVQLSRCRARTAYLLAEEAVLSERMNALLRLIHNAMKKHQGKPLTPASGSGADIALPDEENMTAADLLREASERQEALLVALTTLMSETDEALAETDKILTVLEKVAQPASKFTSDHQRRLSDASTVEAGIPVLAHMKKELFLLKARLLQMEKELITQAKKASTSLTRSETKSKNGGEGGRSGYLALGLGLGLPLALLLVGGGVYCQHRIAKRREDSDLITVTSACGSQGNVRQPDGTEDIQMSPYQFGERGDVFAAFESPQLKVVRSLTSLDTPEAGIPDTTQRQYMVDEHHVVATQLKKEAMRKEQGFERPAS